MDNLPEQTNKGLWIAILVALALVVLLAWQAGLFEAKETVYRADVEEQGGGEIIVTEKNPAAVPVELPEATITPAAPESEAAPAGE